MATLPPSLSPPPDTAPPAATAATPAAEMGAIADTAAAAATTAAIAITGIKRSRAQYEASAGAGSGGDSGEGDEWLLDYDGDDGDGAGASADADADAEVTALLEAEGLIDAAVIAAHMRLVEPASKRARTDAAAAIATAAAANEPAGTAAEAAAAAYEAIAGDDIEQRADSLATTLHEDNRISLRNVATLCDDGLVCGLLRDTLATEVRAVFPLRRHYRAASPGASMLCSLSRP